MTLQLVNTVVCTACLCGETLVAAGLDGFREQGPNRLSEHNSSGDLVGFSKLLVDLSLHHFIRLASSDRNSR